MHQLQCYLRKIATNSILHEKLHFSMPTLRLTRLSHKYARRMTRIRERPLLLHVSRVVVEPYNDVGGTGIGSSRCPLDTATSPGRKTNTGHGTGGRRGARQAPFDGTTTVKSTGENARESLPISRPLRHYVSVVHCSHLVRRSWMAWSWSERDAESTSRQTSSPITTT